jgi:hypothetical protein
MEDFGVSRFGDSHDALNDSENLRRLTKKMVEKLGYGTSESAVLQVLRSHKSIQMNKPSCQDCCSVIQTEAADKEGEGGKKAKKDKKGSQSK